MLDAFHALPRPASPGALMLGQAIAPACRLAVTSEGDVAVAIEVRRDGSSVRRELANLRFEPPGLLEIHGPSGEPRIEHLAVLVCKTRASELQAAFLRIAQVQLHSDTEPMPESELERRLRDVLTLSRALSQPATETVQGLWAELAIIAWSSDPRAATLAWHSNVKARHDFAAGLDRLEVKSSARGLREHTFRLEQLQELPGGRTLVASVLMTPDDRGLAIDDLVAAIVVRLGDDCELHARVQAIVAASLGDQWRAAATQHYDVEAARKSVRFYDALDLPSIPQPIPPEIHEVQFTLDLSSSVAIEQDTQASGLGIQAWLPGAAVPR